MLDEPHHDAGPNHARTALQRAKYWLVEHFGEPEDRWEQKQCRDLAD